MKVVIINRSDLLGGAALASFRLCSALREQGVDVRLLVMDRRCDKEWVQAVGCSLGNRYRFYAERLGIYFRNGRRRDTLFQIDTATHGMDLSRLPFVQEADAIIVGWTNQGMLSLNDVQRLSSIGKPLVWVMHDMWNCTGVCHHAETCNGYLDGCESCPLLPTGSDLAHRTWQRKRQLYSQTDIHFVAVSRWLEQMCRKSSLMHNARISVIPNAIDASKMQYDFLDDNPWNVASGRKVVVMGAARLDDHIKGFDTLIDTMTWLKTRRPDVADRIHLVLYGNLRDTSLLERIAVPYTHLGYVTNLQHVYRHAHVVLSTSRYESFGYTLAEGMACGCVPVTTGRGGQPDIVRHGENGFIADVGTPEQLAQGLEWALDADIPRERLHQWVEDNFSPQQVAKQFIDILT